MRNRSWLLIGVAVSVAINLALGGFIAGHMLRPGPVPAMLDPGLSLFRVIHDLPEPRREAFRATMGERFRTMRGDLRRIRQAQRAINQALEQEPFDAPALEQALKRFRMALLAGQKDNHEVLVKVAAAMTPDERHALRDAMTRRRPPHPHDTTSPRPADDDR